MHSIHRPLVSSIKLVESEAEPSDIDTNPQTFSYLKYE